MGDEDEDDEGMGRLQELEAEVQGLAAKSEELAVRTTSGERLTRATLAVCLVLLVSEIVAHAPIALELQLATAATVAGAAVVYIFLDSSAPDAAASLAEPQAAAPSCGRPPSDVASPASASRRAENKRGSGLTIDTTPRTAVDGWVIKSEAEVTAVEELRSRLQDLAPVCRQRPLDLSDPVLVRFVRARKTLDESEAMFRAAHEFRVERKPEEVYEHFVLSPFMRQYMPGGWCGLDKDGSPVFIDRVGQLDVPALVKHVREEEFINLVIHRQETHTKLMLESERKHGRVQYQLLFIQDCKGLSMRHMHQKGLNILKKAVHIDDNYYPERLKVALVVNAPRIFSFVWNVVKYFFHPNTREKIQIFSGPATSELLKHVDADALPAFLGGNLIVDGDPECASLIGKGGRAKQM